MNSGSTSSKLSDSMKTNLILGLKNSSLEYLEIINYILLNKIFEKSDTRLLNIVTNYLEYHDGHILVNRNYRDNQSMDFKCIWTVHKLHPIIYNAKITVGKEWLINACLKYHNYCVKIYPHLNNIFLSHWVKAYISYLKLCKKHQRVLPSTEEEFIWHIHMLNHSIYVADTTNIFAHILYYEYI